MSRTNRFVTGVLLGYLNQFAIMFGGLWLTPFLLGHLGQRDYGIWLLSLQMLTYLGIAEFGIIALLPRNVGSISGAHNSDGEFHLALRSHLEDSMGLICMQATFVAIGAVGVWFLMPKALDPIRLLIAIILVAYVLLFPFKLFQATLEGLQRQALIATLSTLSWFIGLGVNVVLVWKGYGLKGVAVGWIISQTTLTALCAISLARNFPAAFPRRANWPTLQAAFRRLGNGSWLSLQQIAQILLNGTDLLLIGRILGPNLIAPYACTGKLNSVMSNQPGLLMQTAIPGLSQLRTQSKERVVDVTVALSLGMMFLSGACACVFLSVNEFFVNAWVGPSLYRGFSLTLLMVLLTISRHFNLTFAYTAFSFGYERRMCAVALVEGAIGLLLSIVFTNLWGLYGVVVGPLCALCLTSLVSNVMVVSRDLQQPWYRLLVPLWPWFYRFMIVASASVFVSKAIQPKSVLQVVLMAAFICLVYFVWTIPAMLRSQLGPYLQPKLDQGRRLLSGLFSACIQWRRETVNRG